MTDFRYQGFIPASKSLFNRALIAQSYFSDLQILGHSTCEDVHHLQSSLKSLHSSHELQCGDGGTTLRFLALRAAREKGSYDLRGSLRLMERPQRDLLDLLRALGVNAERQGSGLTVRGEGWQKPKQALRVDTSTSSQFASALLLNAWSLDFDLQFELYGDKVSESYFLMTLSLLQKLGMVIEKKSDSYRVPAGQRVAQKVFQIEPDISSAFTLSVLAALQGQLRIEGFPAKSLQPDIVFLDIFNKMKVKFKRDENSLCVERSENLHPVEWNLAQAPDLFPVLAVLCAHAEGLSRLYGAPHLIHKESNRLAKTMELLNLIGVNCQAERGGLSIEGQGRSRPLSTTKVFNPDKDHRMVMAAMILKYLGHDIVVEEPEVINKSFPEFWDIVGIQP